MEIIVDDISELIKNSEEQVKIIDSNIEKIQTSIAILEQKGRVEDADKLAAAMGKLTDTRDKLVEAINKLKGPASK